MTDKLLDHLKRALGDAYTIERELQGAGMSRVFVAQEHSLGREVVIKVLPKELSAGVNRERFQQEVQLAARLSHPYMVPLLHAGEHEDLLWFTMPFITGESLKYRLEHSGPVPVREVIQFTRDVLEALAYAHSRGVVHRDIKPANILVAGDHAVVTDFGVAKALSAAMPSMGSGHTTTGMAIGTPAYMAPEQLAADPAADHRVDIYAIGLLMYELLAGTSPFSTQSPTATMTAQLTRMPEPLDQLRKDVPPALSKLIMHCLAKSADERPATAEEVLKSLDQISGELAAREHGSGERTMLVRRVIPITAAFALVIVLAAAAMIWVQRHGSPTAAIPPAVPPLVTPPSTDDGQTTVALALSHSDSMKFCLKYADSLKCGLKAAAQPSKATTSKAPVQLPPPNFDSLVKAAVAEQLKSMGITMQRPLTTVEIGRDFRGGGGPPPGGPPQNGPRKVVVAVLNFARRGGPPDTTMKALTDKFVADFKQQNQRRGWQVVQREAGRAPVPNDTTLAGANAFVSINLSPDRNSPDSLELLLTMNNAAGGMRFVRKAVPANKVPPDFQDVLQRASFWLGELQRNPGVSWDSVGARGFQNGGFPRGGPGGGPPGGGGGGGRGGGQGRGGGGRDGGGRPPNPADSGRRGGGIEER